jgi:hypothetical protein
LPVAVAVAGQEALLQPVTVVTVVYLAKVEAMVR